MPNSGHARPLSASWRKRPSRVDRIINLVFASLMFRFAAVAFLNLFLVAALSAQGASPVVIQSGESLTVQFNGATAIVVERRSAGQLPTFEAWALSQMQKLPTPPGSGVLPPVAMRSNTIDPLPITPGQVRISFRRVAAPGEGKGSQALLTIENGYAQAFRYRALMRRGERSAPTDVCDVIPQKPGFEHWPYEIDTLELSELTLVPLDSGQELRCE